MVKSGKTTKSKKKTKKINKLKRKLPEHRSFVLNDGNVISSVKELAIEMDNIDDSVFYYHVNESKNDFSNWLKDVLDEIELAESLMDTKEKYDFQMKLLKHIVKNV